MKVIHRYILGTIGSTSIASVGLFVFILLAGNALKDLIGEWAAGRLNAELGIQLLLLLIPYVTAYALPLGLLTAILIVMGQLSARNEIVAFKATGYSLWNISLPIFVLGLFACMVSLGINGYYAPKAKAEYRNRLANFVRDNPMNFIVPQTFIDQFPGYVIYASSKETDRLKDFWIWRLDEQGQIVNLLRAEQGWFSYEVGDEKLKLTLQNGFSELHEEGKANDMQLLRPSVKFKQAILQLSLAKIFGERRSYRKPSAMTISELVQRKQELTKQLEGIPKDAKEIRDRLYQQRSKVETHLQKKLAFSFSTLALAMVGIPLSIRIGRKETYANTALALLLALAYNFLMIIFGWMEEIPKVRPELLIWLPNLVFFILGCIFFRRASRN